MSEQIILLVYKLALNIHFARIMFLIKLHNLLATLAHAVYVRVEEYMDEFDNL